MDNSANERHLLGKQPARLLMFDLSVPFVCEVVDDVMEALENMFSIACNFNGPSRIPFFSLMTLGDYPEVILPFSYVRNNFARVQSAIADVRSHLYRAGSDVSKASGALNKNNFRQGLEEAGIQFSRQLHSTLQTGGFCQHLEVTILTAQKATTVQRQVEAALASLEMEHVRRIQVASLCSEELTLDDVMLGTSQSSDGSLAAHSASSMLASDLVETCTVDPNSLSLQNFFNGWLLDVGIDCEHMHIILPPTDDMGDPVVLKCDLHERVINPAQLPFYNQFTVHGESSTMKTMFPSTSKAMGLTVPVYRLKVIALVPVTAICDSLVYGLPLIAQATSCWKLDWDELEKNQQMFRAFTHTLANKDQAILAQLQPPDTTSTPPAARQRVSSQESQTVGSFVLIPSSNGSLLVKSVAVQELMLPYNAGSQTEEPTEECLGVINDSLDQLEMMASYNPLCLQSNLYHSLRNMGKKPLRPQQQKRPLLETNEFMNLTNKMVSSKQARSGNKKAALETTPIDDSNIADTPLSARVQKRGLPKLQKRKLYTSPHEMFGVEPDISSPGDGSNNNNSVTARSGRCNRVKPMLHFPTSI